jgi:hypothetical protein
MEDVSMAAPHGEVTTAEIVGYLSSINPSGRQFVISGVHTFWVPAWAGVLGCAKTHQIKAGRKTEIKRLIELVFLIDNTSGNRCNKFIFDLLFITKTRRASSYISS